MKKLLFLALSVLFIAQVNAAPLTAAKRLPKLDFNTNLINDEGTATVYFRCLTTTPAQMGTKVIGKTKNPNYDSNKIGQMEYCEVLTAV